MCKVSPQQEMKLRPFQRTFLRRALAPGIDTAALSLPRGNGKSYLAARILTRFLTPGDPIHAPGKEAVLLSGSIEQARIVFRFCREVLEPTGEYSFIDSATRVAIAHRRTRTRLRVHGSNSKTALGLVNTPFVVWDEPGAANILGGQSLWDAVVTSQGKPGSPLTAILIGTIAPGPSSGWWADLVKSGTTSTTYVQKLIGAPSRWDRWSEIKRCNPLAVVSDEFKKKLLDERDQARKDSRLRARFCSYRLNFPQGDESTMLLTVSDFEDMAKRAVPPREGLPIVALDLGHNRAWSAALALYKNGRVECRALAPGVPDLGSQEQRDNVPKGTYQRLADQGVLIQAEGLRVPPVSLLMTLVKQTWGRPSALIADRFRLDDLHDAGVPCRVTPRVTRWSEASYDIRALRSRTKDGPFAVSPCSRSLLAASLAVCTVRNDDAGSVRIVKKGFNNQARDDVAAAFVLAAGEYERASSVQRLTISRTPF